MVVEAVNMVGRTWARRLSEGVVNLRLSSRDGIGRWPLLLERRKVEVVVRVSRGCGAEGLLMGVNDVINQWRRAD